MRSCSCTAPKLTLGQTENLLGRHEDRLVRPQRTLRSLQSSSRALRRAPPTQIMPIGRVKSPSQPFSGGCPKRRLGQGSIPDVTRCQGETCGYSRVFPSDKLISENKAIKKRQNGMRMRQGRKLIIPPTEGRAGAASELLLPASVRPTGVTCSQQVKMLRSMPQTQVRGRG